MTQLVSRKTANELIDSIYMAFHFNLMAISDSGIENSQERDLFWTEANKVDQKRFEKDYLPTLNSLDAVGFKKYYKLVGEFATKFKIPGWKDYNNYEPLLIEELNDVLAKHEKTEDKLDLIDSFTVEELQSEEFIFASKVQVLYDILDDWFVFDDKERGINKVLESFNSNDKSAFIAKIQSDRRLLDALIDKVNGTQKDEMFAIMGEIFISSGFIKDQKVESLNNLKNDNISATYTRGKVFIEVTRPEAGGRKDYSTKIVKTLSKSPFDIIGLNYDGREIKVPALLLLNSWSNIAATPEGIFFNYKDENIDWSKLSDEEKDKYFFDYVKHYLPSGFVEALGSPLQMVITGIITIGLAIGTGGASAIAELELVLGAAGLALTGMSVYGSIRGIMAANEMKASATTMHEAKKAAKVMAQNIAQLSLNVIDLLFTAKDLVKGLKGKNAKIKKEASFANQSQIDAVSGVKDPNVELINVEHPHDYTMKSNYGEMKTDIDLEQNGGYQRVSDFRVTSLKDKGHHGIDGIYKNMNPPPDFIIVDSKYLGTEKAVAETFAPTMSKVKNGSQMDSKWIEKNLADSINDENLLKEIQKSLRSNRVDSVAAKIDNTGKLTYYQLDSEGKVMLDKVTNSPIIYNINKE